MSNLRVLIVGASIAGPTAAYWFARAGATVTVIERFPHLRTNGQNVDIRTSGVTVMRRIPGLEATIRANLLKEDGITLVGSGGTLYGTIEASGNPDQQTLLSEYEIFRGKLSSILYDLTKHHQRVKYIFNEQITAIRQDEQGGSVKVDFVNETPSAEYDLIVGCDGASSRTRAIGLGCGVRDHMYPTGIWSVYFSIKQDLLSGSRTGHGYSSLPGRFLTIGQDPDGGNMVMMMTVNSPTDAKVLPKAREAMKQDGKALKQFVADYYRGAGWKTDEVLDGMMESENLYASEIVKVQVPSLSSGRFVLVGDAGYAPGLTGTGTTLALTGAYVLAGEICKHKGDVEAGLQGYETTMRPLITKMTKLPPFVTAFMAPQTAWGLWLRNNLFWLITSLNIPRFAQWAFGSASGDIKEFPLPDYEWLE